ncbi:phosphopantetheine-binding protein [Paenibacillus sp. MMS18-CY102]|uniref:phosphopantetheine-binding protein n=1 Tax=Paenibacillus sp. MMS18-CY102 TaxID=2682849 RepID=UPI00136573F4|nr:phosphopantetheine-binding protein [Paenibacillus sp. MMS18-CY102]MWC29949.1 acyl carrier protein [Paenibacillus sp. MMS18-CY102]
MERIVVLQQVETLLRENLQLQLPGALEESLRLNEDLRIDSIMMLQLIVLLERELGLRVPEQEVDARAFATVGSLLDFIARLEPMDGGAA